ncbi:hypothetical protein FJ414_13870 [Mesorhizobium sp. B3-1-6]|uniref:hypothetical protein n=1 Tax=unclassified Mesorhizobium TaxID=325217 RepID=UPI0011270712|nr:MULTISPECIES: hypothetical protein [unclassified Mesorhizobium]TPI37436.1 hypothetical protein FJ414_13870 [Mesorhizobium sp. B3-1-6]UCI24892.1 hypothetical protein FJ430_25415 [Mesorhizobium sp. B2-8-5]
MTRPTVEIGDRVAVIATVVERNENRVMLRLDGDSHKYSMVEPNAKAGDKFRLEGEVVHVDEDLGRTTVQVLGRVTVDTRSVEMVTRRCDLDHIGSNVPGHPRPRTPPRPHG